MTDPPQLPRTWRGFYPLALALVFAAFMLSVREVLNPFVLLVLLVLLLAPLAGSRAHLILVAASTVLTVVWVLQTTGFLLAPFFLALVFAYIFRPLVRALERRRVPTSLGIGLLFVPLIAAIVVLIVIGIPALSEQVARFIEAVPALVETGAAWADRMSAELARRDLPFIDDQAIARLRAVEPETIVAYLRERQSAIAGRVWSGIMGAGRGLSAILTILGYVFLTPIVAFYVLRDFDRITARVVSLVPRARLPAWSAFAREYDRLLSRYLRGQLLAAAIVGILTGLGFWIVGFPYALLLGVTAGVFNIVPYLGLAVSLVPALVIAIFSGSFLLSLGKIALVFGVVQLLDGSVVGPKIVGESVGLHPVWVILALAVFGFFFGFVGLLLAVPLAVLAKLLLRAAFVRYQASRLYLGDG